jgi:hypothetical protein
MRQWTNFDKLELSRYQATVLFLTAKFRLTSDKFYFHRVANDAHGRRVDYMYSMYVDKELLLDLDITRELHDLLITPYEALKRRVNENKRIASEGYCDKWIWC